MSWLFWYRLHLVRVVLATSACISPKTACATQFWDLKLPLSEPKWHPTAIPMWYLYSVLQCFGKPGLPRESKNSQDMFYTGATRTWNPPTMALVQNRLVRIQLQQYQSHATASSGQDCWSPSHRCQIQRWKVVEKAPKKKLKTRIKGRLELELYSRKLTSNTSRSILKTILKQVWTYFTD